MARNISLAILLGVQTIFVLAWHGAVELRVSG